VSPRLKQAGLAAGINFTGATDRYPNSIKAHTLLDFVAAAEPSKQHALQEVLFRHYFTDGKYPNLTHLREAAVEVKLENIEKAMAYVKNESNQRQVREEALRHSSGGISGVPYFFVNQQPLGSGAQPPSVFSEAIARAS